MSSELPPRADFVVIGGGVVGLAVALELRGRFPDQQVVVLEKEGRVGEHQSGRNSGVLHAGFYYSSDSLKSRLTRDGNRRMVAWCAERGVEVKKTGKLVVCRSQADHPGLDELLRRGRAAGVELEELDEAGARAIEPRARTVGRALLSPTTATVDPGAVMRAMADACREAGIALALGGAWRGRRGSRVCTSRGDIEAGFVVNAAGLQAAEIAHAYGFGERYAIVPFKGLYLMGDERAPRLACHVYPVPDLAMPFLGVHVTVRMDGGIKIGPTAMPAPWLESYGKMRNFRLREIGEVLANGARLLLGDPRVRRHAIGELPKQRRSVLVGHAGELVEGLRLEHFTRWGRPGIRAQLVDRRRGKLVMDFCYEGDRRSMHVLNAVSPAFTCALSFAEHVVDAIEDA